MKPAMFEYYRPSNLKEAVQLIDEFGDECKIIAGGQSLIPLLNMRLARPSCLIDINSLSELNYIKDIEGIVLIGATTRQRELEKSNIIKQTAPVLIEAIRNIGHPQTRSRGTVGGSLVHAEPSAELSLVLLALDAKVTIIGKKGVRKLPLDKFLISEFTTALTEREILTEISYDGNTVPSGFAFEEFAIRQGDFAIASAVSLISTVSGGIIDYARVVLGGIASRPIIAESIENLLRGKNLTKSLIDESCSIIENIADVGDDLHSSSDYKVNLSKVMFERSLRRAYEMAIDKEVVN